MVLCFDSTDRQADEVLTSFTYNPNLTEPVRLISLSAGHFAYPPTGIMSVTQNQKLLHLEE